ncbi:MAG: histidine kinase [Oscillospiraceae bacterium]|nr:histidine kinase [Oscillospiraceae bacterium]
MDSWITVTNLSLDTAALMLMIIGILSIMINRSMDSWSRRFFGVLFIVLFFYVFFNWCSVIWRMLGEPAWLPPPKPALFWESLLSGMLIPLLVVYLLRCTGEDIRKSGLFALILGLFAVYAVLLIVTQFTTFIYYYSLDGEYHRGPWYPLLLVPPILSMLALFAAVLRRRERLSRRQFTSFLVYSLMPLIGMLIQIAFYGLYTIVLFTAAAAMVMYVSMLTDQVESYVRQQEVLATQRANILVLQMRPHFIYNTLTGIYHLCGSDPAAAQRVINDFSNYLQHNFTAIAKKETIPFREELEHTRAYLAVEQARHEGMLHVTMDTPFINFRLPPLTLEPVVENAVKHAFDPSAGTLEIVLRTRETGKGAEITVEDNGPGYSPADDNEPHIGLENIRERLSMMCGGNLTIEMRDTGGTKVTISIPGKK